MSGRIHVFPAWEQNPYLNMLHIGARAEGWRIEGSKGVEELARALPGLTAGDIFHIHWTSPVLNQGTYDDAARALERFAELLTALKNAGVAIVWTVHNTFSHNAPFQDLEVELALLLADQADGIIQLNRNTAAAVSEFYKLPREKLVTIRHASYSGVYSAPPTQWEARQTLGISASVPVVGFVGQIRGYKGIPTLLRAVEEAGAVVDDLTLVLAGKTPAEEISLIERALPPGVPVVRHHSFISNADIATWFSACDIMVFPYERVLNSGSVLLSATFERPCILPAEPHLIAEYGDQTWVSFYEVGENQVSALAAAIPAALSRADSERVHAARFASEYTTRDMAADYLSFIERLTSISPRHEESR